MTLFLPAPLNETNADDWKSSLSVATGNLCWVAGNRDTSRHKKCHESPERPSAGSIGNLSMQNSPSGAAQAVLGAKLPRVGTKLARSKSKVCRPRICYSAPQIKSAQQPLGHTPSCVHGLSLRQIHNGEGWPPSPGGVPLTP